MYLTSEPFFRNLLHTLVLLLLVFPRVALSGEGPQYDELDSMESTAREKLIVKHPELEDKLDKLPGYAVISMAAAKIPGVGMGAGYGVVIDNRNDARSYIKVSQFEVGGGLGAEKFKVVILFDDEKPLDRIASGGWRYEGSADLSASSDSSESSVTLSSKSGKGYQVFKLAEGGALATITIRLLYANPYLID